MTKHSSHRRVRVALVSGVAAAAALSAGAVAYAADGTPTSGTASPGTGTDAATTPRTPPVPPAPSPYDARGIVTALGGSSLTLRTDAGQSLTYRLTDTTAYRGGPDQTLTRSSISVGERVEVRGEQDGDTRVARAVEAHPAHLDGTVTGTDSGTITLVDRDGFTRTVRTDADTVYRADGASADSSAVTTGKHVRAEGRVAPDGTSLDATRVEVGNPVPPARGPLGPGPGRPAAGNQPPGVAPGGPAPRAQRGPAGGSGTGAPAPSATATPEGGVGGS